MKNWKKGHNWLEIRKSLKMNGDDEILLVGNGACLVLVTHWLDEKWPNKTENVLMSNL